MPTATIDTKQWTMNDLVPQCVLAHEAANCFPLKVGRAIATLPWVTETHPWTIYNDDELQQGLYI